MTVILNSIDELPLVFADIDRQFSDIDYSGPLAEFNRYLAEQHSEQFAGGFSPTGERWAPLAESTVARKGHATILVDKGNLRQSLTVLGSSDNVNAVSERGSLFGTRDAKSVFHQFGTSRMPQREHVGTNDDGVDHLAELIVEHAIESLKNSEG